MVYMHSYVHKYTHSPLHLQGMSSGHIRARDVAFFPCDQRLGHPPVSLAVMQFRQMVKYNYLDVNMKLAVDIFGLPRRGELYCELSLWGLHTCAY